jgi:hypothetical protein
MGHVSREASGSRWLRQLRQVFDAAAGEPTLLYLDGAQFGDELPAGRIALPQLRDLLLAPQTSLATRDAVWRELIGRARRERRVWVVAAVGMAMPSLVRRYRMLSGDFRGDRADLEAEIVYGFLRALYRIDVRDRALCARLVRAAGRAGLRLVYEQAAFEGSRWALYRSRTPRPPFGHPDLLLVDAVMEKVISWEEASLIATTRLEGMPIDQVAARLGVRTNTLVVRRHRAEHAVAEAIVQGWVCSDLIGGVLRAEPDALRPVDCPHASTDAVLAGGGEAPCDCVWAGVSTGAGNPAVTRRPFPVAGSPGRSG